MARARRGEAYGRRPCGNRPGHAQRRIFDYSATIGNRAHRSPSKEIEVRRRLAVSDLLALKMCPSNRGVRPVTSSDR